MFLAFRRNKNASIACFGVAKGAEGATRAGGAEAVGMLSACLFETAAASFLLGRVLLPCSLVRLLPLRWPPVSVLPLTLKPLLLRLAGSRLRPLRGTLFVATPATIVSDRSSRGVAMHACVSHR